MKSHPAGSNSLSKSKILLICNAIRAVLLLPTVCFSICIFPFKASHFHGHLHTCPWRWLISHRLSTRKRPALTPKGSMQAHLTSEQVSVVAWQASTPSDPAIWPLPTLVKLSYLAGLVQRSTSCQSLFPVYNWAARWFWRGERNYFDNQRRSFWLCRVLVLY